MVVVGVWLVLLYYKIDYLYKDTNKEKSFQDINYLYRLLLILKMEELVKVVMLLDYMKIQKPKKYQQAHVKILFQKILKNLNMMKKKYVILIHLMEKNILKIIHMLR